MEITMAEGTRINKRQLKEIVKECLLEILNEGLGSSLQQTNVQTESHAKQSSRQIRPRSAALDTPIGKMRQSSSQRRPTNALLEAINTEAGNSDIMRNILADTAATTLQTMINNNDAIARPQEGITPSLSQQEHFVGNPDEVFGDDVASKWATLAFEKPAKK
jgi:chemotaxis protein CheY-P-specific phosphatase CheC